MEKNLLFIVNPASGKGQISQNLMNITDIFIKAGYRVRLHTTQDHLDAKNLVTSEGENYDLIVAAGGDGTLSEVIGGVLRLENRVKIGYIPCGSTNDFANSLQLPKQPVRAARVITDGVPFRCDTGSFNDRNFNYVAAFGAFTDVSYETPQENKNMFGHLAYIIEGMSRLPKLPSYEMKITCDGETISGNFILGMIMNSNFVGGIKGDRLVKADLSDGLFELLLFETPSNILDLQGIITSLIRGESEGKGYFLKKVKEVTVETDDEIKWTLDGEFGGNDKKAKIEVIEHAVDIMVAKDNKAISAADSDDKE
ncbi:MAG: YegS/Rv2252/BmrU family lipid kinase [Firmicutes bacterium]|nr:YegS/Rv2252/BmrU family lipid kinase [Bacillota bacterium]